MPLLRRGVKNIIACVATHADPAALTKEQFAIGEEALLRVRRGCWLSAFASLCSCW
jgi:hypothetical protein